MILVTRPAPQFIAPAVLPNGNIIENFNFYQYTENKITVIFFWPLDFTYVCPSEIITFNKYYDEFDKRNVKLLGVSCDSQYVHKAWRNTDINQGGIGHIKFIMISDIKKNIQQQYGVEHPDLSIALRATFIIDEKHIIKHQTVNDLFFGRNIHETLRIIDAIKHYKKYGQVCPAQWTSGKHSIIPTEAGIKDYLSHNLKELN
ncbi:redoxin domain-containing protein [Enterobacteriaceae endosymbiont of Macroplea mutica]|uniref:peroxiredoxin n=1 Tax=Enterobacteriaceae endosymbiont of Macroplea mutica TaxID=2675791 RepID=UPI001448B326|nr:redoxin domain-containing protein [Enterobacteriaceae endosymbiont of Macroplea mutica]QJC31195.1 redoxin domain-containing protein [Enterobacteriaceae endosymbiont of Macroplea mutica]